MKLFACILLFFVFFCNTAFASSISSSTSQSEISHEQELTVQVSLSIQASNSTNYYLRGVFYKEGTSDYCGFTWNGNDWFAGPYSSNEGWKKFLKISIQENSWSGEIKAKIDPSDSGCKESGEYKFKIQRFNETSGSSAFDDQNTLSVLIVIPSPTHSPTPTVKPTSAPKPTSSPKPEATLKPSPTLKAQNIQKKEITNPVPTQNISEEHDQEIVEERVLGQKSDPNDFLLKATHSSILQISPTEIDTKNNAQENTKSQKSSAFLGGGGVAMLISSCGILVFKKLKEKF